jgi:hypothetical protein
MFRCGETFGTVDWETNQAYLMGSRKTKSTEYIEEKLRVPHFVKDIENNRPQ